MASCNSSWVRVWYWGFIAVGNHTFGSSGFLSSVLFSRGVIWRILFWTTTPRIKVFMVYENADTHLCLFWLKRSRAGIRHKYLLVLLFCYFNCEASWRHTWNHFYHENIMETVIHQIWIYLWQCLYRFHVPNFISYIALLLDEVTYFSLLSAPCFPVVVSFTISFFCSSYFFLIHHYSFFYPSYFYLFDNKLLQLD